MITFHRGVGENIDSGESKQVMRPSVINSFFEQFHGPNAGYVLELYDRYLEDPDSVDPEVRAAFAAWQPPPGALPLKPASGESAAAGPCLDPAIISAAVHLAQAIRSTGHRTAQLDPLGSPPPGDPWHTLEYHGIDETDLCRVPAAVIGGPLADRAENACQAITWLREIYTTNTGYDYDHILDPRERDWLRDAAEMGTYRPPNSPVDGLALLERLTRVESFELFLHRIFPGKTRFSIEGVDMLVPMLDELVACAGESGARAMIIGMAHRGRLNVLAHLLGKPFDQILAEFKDPLKHFSTRDELGWTGDVKYHTGGRRAVQENEQVSLILSMPPNPSHLEHIDPVVMGMARASGTLDSCPGVPEFDPEITLPVLIHGDASFPGQGIVAETLNFSRLSGYEVGGTVHIITNNQLGYTTLPGEGRSTTYSSDLARGFEIPILHVNADDPISCIEAIRTAYAYREIFHKDFLVDLIGYRRYGHNEGDEPGFTQPQMYARIEQHPSVRKLWVDRLVQSGELQPQEPERAFQQAMDEMQSALERLEPEAGIAPPEIEPPPRGAARKVKTSLPLEQLEALNASLLQTPEGFSVHRKIERGMRRRQEIFRRPDDTSIDWAAAEELALASILADGVPIRITGEDVERGTFSQRHAVFHDTRTGEQYTPLQALPQSGAAFEIHNSPLSENGALGFEYGYNIARPEALVIWEAQYGDFINTAQAVIDEFILSARSKWEQTPSLVLLLPHGHEGQGPDHSTGRPERFLQLAADINLRLANCTTSAQYFHLLRRQAALLKTDPLPLIVLTPKSLLRNPLVASSPRQLAEGQWCPVLDDERAAQNPEEIERILLCSGKIYLDLIASEAWKSASHLAILRIEQLYRFPEEPLREILGKYRRAREFAWVQEEPRNMGAWGFVAPRLQSILDELFENGASLAYIGREESSSPAEGSTALHQLRQARIMDQAFTRALIGQSARVKEG